MSGVISFTRGRSLYQIARAIAEGGYVGFRDGRVVARGLERAEIAQRMITLPMRPKMENPPHPEVGN